MSKKQKRNKKILKKEKKESISRLLNDLAALTNQMQGVEHRTLMIENTAKLNIENHKKIIKKKQSKQRKRQRREQREKQRRLLQFKKKRKKIRKKVRQERIR